MITAEERAAIEELPGRQNGCSDKTCGVCRENTRRGAALAKLLREYDAMGAALAAVRDIAEGDCPADINWALTEALACL